MFERKLSERKAFHENMCLPSISLNLIRCLSRYHGKRREAASNRQLCCGVWMNHTAILPRLKLHLSQSTGSLLHLFCQTRHSNLLCKKKKERRCLMSPTSSCWNRHPVLITWGKFARAFICFETFSCSWHIRQNSARTLSLTIRITRKNNLVIKSHLVFLT